MDTEGPRLRGTMLEDFFEVLSEICQTISDRVFQYQKIIKDLHCVTVLASFFLSP